MSTIFNELIPPDVLATLSSSEPEKVGNIRNATRANTTLPYGEYFLGGETEPGSVVEVAKGRLVVVGAPFTRCLCSVNG